MSVPIAVRRSSQRALLGQSRLDVDRRVLRHVLTHRVDDEEAVAAAAVDPEEPAQLRVVHVDDALVAVAQQLGAVGAEVDGDAARELRMAAHADAQPRARRAAIAVRGDDVARAHLALVPGVEVAQRDRRAVVVLIDGDRLGAVADRRAELERALAQNRLERVLVDEDADGGAEALDALVELLDVGGELASRERLDRDDAARRAVGLQRLRAHPLLEPHLADHLHRAQLEVSRARMDRRARVALHRQRRHAVVAEQHGRRQTHQAAADDQDRDLLVSHGATLDAPATMCQLNLVIREIHRSNEPRRPGPQPARRARRPAQRAQRHAGGAARRAQPAGHEQRARPAAPALRRSAARPPGRDARAHRAGRGAGRPGARGARAHPRARSTRRRPSTPRPTAARSA